MTLSLALLAVLAQDAGTPPVQLACLPTWYQGRVVHRADAGWGLDLGDGGFLPWDVGNAVTDADSDESFDLQDVFEVPYTTGPIVPVESKGDEPDEDPGRVRLDALFKATYGASRPEIERQLTKVRFFGLRYPFHAKAAPALERVVARLTEQVKADPKLLPFFRDIGGTWAFRRIARSPHLSAHAFGIAIDLNVKRSTYWRWQRPKRPLVWKNQVPQAVVDAFEAEGFIWGGRWVHYDTMHFEYRPELTSPLCRGAAPREAPDAGPGSRR